MKLLSLLYNKEGNDILNEKFNSSLVKFKPVSSFDIKKCKIVVDPDDNSTDSDDDESVLSIELTLSKKSILTKTTTTSSLIDKILKDSVNNINFSQENLRIYFTSCALL